MKIEDMISTNRADCCGCEACANICPKNAITMTRDAEGFAYPKINPELCIKCGRCDATCPALNYVKNYPADFPLTFVATYDNDKILRHSSSGGIFTALSEIILREGGVIFGASFDKNWHVYHTSAKTLDELKNLRGIKYVQSKIGDVYQQIKDALKSTKVLFSGTPCQCVALRSFLGGDHENLLTVEIICHGVPSPGVWEYYINKLGYAHEIASVNFRSKRNGWGSDIEINYLDRGHYICQNAKDFYGKLFYNSLSNRSSCAACKFKIPNGQSDLTIGDAWGVKKFAPEMFDSRGTSIVFIHTDKGKEFFDHTNLRTKQVKFLSAISYNPSSIIAHNAEPRRADFFADFAKSADKFAVMEKYYYQDLDEATTKQIKKQKKRALSVAYREIAASVRKKFTQNILVATPLDEATKKNLIDRFAQEAPNSTLYFLRLNDKGELICKEDFSSLDFPIKSEVAALKEFVEKFNVAQVITMEPLNFEVPAVAEWLKVCELPIQNLSQPLK